MSFNPRSHCSCPRYLLASLQSSNTILKNQLMNTLYRVSMGPLSFHSLNERCTSKIAEAPGALIGRYSQSPHKAQPDSAES